MTRLAKSSIVNIFSDPKANIILGLNFIEILTFVITIFLIAILAKTLKLTKKQWKIFILTTLFWTSIKLIRSFRGEFAKNAFNPSNAKIVASVLAIYGFISIFIRLPFGFISDKIKSRIWLVRFAAFAIAVTSIWVGLSSNPTSLETAMWWSALSLGIGASVWGLMNVMFSESLANNKALVAVSVLSIPPLLADYIAAPFQNVALNNTVTFMGQEVANYWFMWIVSAIFAIMTLVFSFFISEDSSSVQNLTKKALFNVLFSWKIWIISLLGMAVLFIKFASSGAIMQNYFSTLTDDSLTKAYLSTMFSLTQMIAGVLAGIFFKRKIGTLWTLILGIALMVAFAIVTSVTSSAGVVFITYTLNGFGYGLSYNVLLGLAIMNYKNSQRGWAMGIYQTFNAIGIYYGTRIANIAISKSSPSSYKEFAKFNGLLGISLIIMVWLSFKLLRKNKKTLETKNL